MVLDIMLSLRNIWKILYNIFRAHETTYIRNELEISFKIFMFWLITSVSIHSNQKIITGHHFFLTSILKINNRIYFHGSIDWLREVLIRASVVSFADLGYDHSRVCNMVGSADLAWMDLFHVVFILPWT